MYTAREGALKETLNKEMESCDKGGWNPLARARYYWLTLKRMHGNPECLARGIALGAFIGATPTIPLHTIQIVFFSPFLRANPLAAIISSLIVSNPVTIPLEYYAAWKTGTIITGFSIPWDEVESMLFKVEHTDIWNASLLIMHKSLNLIEVMLIGGLVLAIPTGLAAYILSLHFYQKRQEHKKTAREKLNDGEIT